MRAGACRGAARPQSGEFACDISGSSRAQHIIKLFFEVERTLGWKADIRRQSALAPKVNRLVSSAKFFRLVAIALAAVSFDGAGRAALAQVNIAPQALTHYANCIEQAEQFDLVHRGEFVRQEERGTIYRCRDEVAISYYNDLGRQRRRSEDQFVTNETGAYELRPIRGVGYCWHKVENELRVPISVWGCDVYVAY